METNKSESSWGVWYILGGLAVGAAAGLLWAPKSGIETRGDIEEWRVRNRKKALSWLSSVGDAIPFRVKAAAGIGAAKGATKEALEMSKDKTRDFAHS
jgi:gas vesicle protein